MKTLAIRLEEEQHAQLSLIARLEDLSLVDAIRQAIDAWIEQRRSNPELLARAEAVLADIDRDAAVRRGAIAALVSNEQPRAGTTSGVSSRRRGPSKGGDESSA
jgi:hypothetical protein